MSDETAPDVDCRRLGLRCVDCLPRNQWCDLCTERYPVTVSLPNEPWPWSYVCLGWADLVNRLVADLDEAAPGYRVNSVKEKFAGLRFGIEASGLTTEQTQRALTLIRAAEAESMTVCDVCGQPGTLHTSGDWWRTRCAEHVDLIPRDLDDPDAVLAKIEWPEGEEYTYP